MNIITFNCTDQVLIFLWIYRSEKSSKSDVGDARRLLFSIIYVCKPIVFYVLGPISLLGY